MTTGLITSGSPVGEFASNASISSYSRKEWSGDDWVGTRKENRPLLHTSDQEHNYLYRDCTYFYRGSNPGMGYPFGGWGAVMSGIMSWDDSSWAAANKEQSLQNRLLSAIRTHDFNLGVAVAEGRETVKLIQNTAKSLAKSFLALKKGKFRKAVEALMLDENRNVKTVFLGNGKARYLLEQRRFTSKDDDSRWLELQYGWKPLLQDVYEGAKAYASFYERPRRTVVRAREKLDWHSQTIAASPTLFNSNCLSLQRKVLRCYVSESDASWSRELGLFNPALIAWELVPYSFVIDWLYPLGEWFENLDLYPLLNNHIVWYTKLQHWTYNLQSTGADWWMNNAFTAGESSYINRGIYDIGSEHPLPHFIPLDEAMSPARVRTAIALVRSAFRKN